MIYLYECAVYLIDENIFLCVFFSLKKNLLLREGCEYASNNSRKLSIGSNRNPNNNSSHNLNVKTHNSEIICIIRYVGL